MRAFYGGSSNPASASLRSNIASRLHPREPLAIGPATGGGVAGLTRFHAPFFKAGGTFRFWSFSRVETSGGIRASLAGRYASALFDLARDQRSEEHTSEL